MRQYYDPNHRPYMNLTRFPTNVLSLVQNLTKNLIWCSVVMPSSSPPVWDSCSVLPIFYNLITFEECLSIIFQTAPGQVCQMVSRNEKGHMILARIPQKWNDVLPSVFTMLTCLVTGDAGLVQLVGVVWWAEEWNLERPVHRVILGNCGCDLIWRNIRSS